MRVTTVLLAILLSYAIAPSATAAESTVKITGIKEKTKRPTDTSVTYGDVYGTVSFTSSITSTEIAANFLNVLVDSQFASDVDGNFLVTLAVMRAGTDKAIAERPILTGARKEKKFLWWTTKTSETGAVDMSGTLMDEVIVNGDNNNLRVALKIYYSDKVTFDTKSYSELLRLLDSARALANLMALPTLITGNTETISKLINTVLSSEEDKTVQIASEMSFINTRGFDANGINRQSPNRQVFQVVGSHEDGTQVRFTIIVDFTTKSSRIGIYDPTKIGNGPKRKGFSDWALSGRFIGKAVLPIGGAIGPERPTIKVTELIEKSGPKSVTTAWAALGETSYDPTKTKVDAAAFCKELFLLLSSTYTERDAAGLYWDILHSLRSNLAKTAGAKECVEQKRELIDAHGLKLEPLSDIKL